MWGIASGMERKERKSTSKPIKKKNVVKVKI